MVFGMFVECCLSEGVVVVVLLSKKFFWLVKGVAGILGFLLPEVVFWGYFLNFCG